MQLIGQQVSQTLIRETVINWLDSIIHPSGPRTKKTIIMIKSICAFYQQLISVHEQLSKLTGESVIMTNKTKKKQEKKPSKKEAKPPAAPQPKPKQKTAKAANVTPAQPKPEKPAKKQSASKRSANSK